MSYSESAYESYNEVRALAARAAGQFPSSNNLRLQKPICALQSASEVYERRSPDGDRWRPRLARDRSPAGYPVLQEFGRQLATPSCKGSVASWQPRAARDRSPAGDPVLQGTGRQLATQFRDGLVALWRPDRMMVL
ncbi:hypothetical protein F2Q69_00043493 [Brassica cretica]|uniref:Uncharacterized protein n=1 Tax=Brassica cretica TaxID=69181 RepID=A0A8S9NT33_BRACR|nr:hypothetical protein F2Q69_00043493 [Brassica cretica]